MKISKVKRSVPLLYRVANGPGAVKQPVTNIYLKHVINNGHTLDFRIRATYQKRKEGFYAKADMTLRAAGPLWLPDFMCAEA